MGSSIILIVLLAAALPFEVVAQKGFGGFGSGVGFGGFASCAVRILYPSPSGTTNIFRSHHAPTPLVQAAPGLMAETVSARTPHSLQM
jgi:hypothetical protein